MESNEDISFERAFRELLTKEINMLTDIVSTAEEKGLTNEQWYIDFENELNKLSIKDHNK